MRTVLPFHSPVDPDELAALIVLEHITRREFYKREKPDLNSVDNKIGVEVTRAYLPEYERHNGKIISDELKGGGLLGTSGGIPSFGPSVTKALERIKDRVVDKMQKLNGYEQYPLNYLYVKSFIWSFYCELHTLPNMFDALKEQIIQTCENAKDETGMVIPYKQFDVILLECADMFVIWDWNNNSLMFRPDAFDEYKNQCYNVFHLISDEIDNGVSAVDNTPLKCMNRLFSERCED